MENEEEEKRYQLKYNKSNKNNKKIILSPASRLVLNDTERTVYEGK